MKIAFQPYILTGMACYAVSLVVWIMALSRVPVSIAYPMLSIGYVINAFVAYFWFGEALAYRARAGLTGEMPAHQLFWSDRDGNPLWVEGRFALTMQWLQPPLYEPDVRPDDMRPRKDDVRHGADVLLLSNPRT